MGFNERPARVGSPRLKSHRAFVREWIAQTADLVTWLREVAPDTCLQDTANSNKASEVIASLLDEESIFRSPISANELDNAETQLANVKAKMEELKFNLLAGVQNFAQPEHKDAAPKVSTSLGLVPEAILLSPSQSKSQEIAAAYPLIARRCEEEKLPASLAHIQTADGQVHTSSQPHEALVHTGNDLQRIASDGRPQGDRRGAESLFFIRRSLESPASAQLAGMASLKRDAPMSPLVGHEGGSRPSFRSYPTLLERPAVSAPSSPMSGLGRVHKMSTPINSTQKSLSGLSFRKPTHSALEQHPSAVQIHDRDRLDLMADRLDHMLRSSSERTDSRNAVQAKKEGESIGLEEIGADRSDKADIGTRSDEAARLRMEARRRIAIDRLTDVRQRIRARWLSKETGCDVFIE